MFKSEFDQIVRENFDLSDGTTRRYIATLEDAGQDQLLSALSLSMYESIVSKVDDIDFGTIPMSRGDITKVQGFANTEECLKIMRALVIEYKQNPSIVDVVLTTIQNMKDSKHMFVKGYSLNAEFAMLMYNLIVLSIERSTSLMIATCIQFVKDPSSSNPKKALDKVAYQRTMDDMLFKQLVTINNLFKNGSMDKLLEETMKAVRENAGLSEYEVVAPIDEEDYSKEDGKPNNKDFAEDLFGDGNTTNSDESVDNIPNDAPVEPTGEEIPVTNNEEDDISSEIRVEPTTAADEQDSNMEVELTVGDGDTKTTQTQNIDLKDWDKTPEPEEGATTDANDSVEPDNIPSVTPGDDISDNDTSINEEESFDEGFMDVAKGAAKTVANLYNNGSIGTKLGTIAGVAALSLFVLKGAKDITIKYVIPTVRSIVYGFHYTRMKFSDYLDIQADLIESNANELEYSNNSGMDDNKKEKVIERQRKSAAKLRKWANIFNIDKKEVENKSRKALSEDEKKKKKIAKDNEGDYALF